MAGRSTKRSEIWASLVRIYIQCVQGTFISQVLTAYDHSEVIQCIFDFQQRVSRKWQVL